MVAVQLGPITIYQEGISHGLSLMSRVLAMEVVAIAVLMTTHPSDLFSALARLHVPYILNFMLAMTLYFPILLQAFGNPDKGPMVGGYLGVLLQGMAFLAIGLMASSLTQNQIIAAAVTFVALLMLWLSDALSRQLNQEEVRHAGG